MPSASPNADPSDSAEAIPDPAVAGSVWRLARLAVARSRFMRFRLAGATPSAIVPAPDEPWFPLVAPRTGFADDFYLGRVRLAGRLRLCDRSPFAPVEDDARDDWADWTRALHGFGWLRPLRDADTPLARAQARILVRDWLNLFGTDLSHEAWEPAVAARRLDAWLSHHDWLAPDDEADGNGDELARAIARHARALRLFAGATEGMDRVEVGAALAFAQTAAGMRGRGLTHVQNGLRTVLADDGGPRSGEPRDAVRLLSLLVRVAENRAAAESERKQHAFLLRAIDGLRGWLSALLHADGRVAQLQGTGWLPRALLAELLSDAGRARPNGFARLEGPHGAVVVADRGEGPFDTGGAFEMSVPAGRLVVSCGVPERHGALRDALQGAAAHSTLAVDLPGDAGDAVAQPSTDGGSEGGLLLETPRGPLLHRRKLRFLPEGLAGSDEITGDAKEGTRATLRFHLHSDVAAVPESAHAVALTLTGGGATKPGGGHARWTFHCVDATVRVEDTVLFTETATEWSEGQGSGSKQLVVDMPLEAADTDETGQGARRELRWMFVRST